jgi:threonine aldolase
VRTNILVFGLADHGPDAPTVVARARERGVLVFAFGTRVVRAVTHLDVSDADCRQAASRLLEAIDRDT